MSDDFKQWDELLQEISPTSTKNRIGKRKRVHRNNIDRNDSFGTLGPRKKKKCADSESVEAGFSLQNASSRSNSIEEAHLDKKRGAGVSENESPLSENAVKNEGDVIQSLNRQSIDDGRIIVEDTSGEDPANGCSDQQVNKTYQACNLIGEKERDRLQEQIIPSEVSSGQMKNRKIQVDVEHNVVSEWNDMVGDRSGDSKGDDSRNHSISHVNAFQAGSTHTGDNRTYSVMNHSRLRYDINSEDENSQDNEFNQFLEETNRTCSFESGRKEKNMRKRMKALEESTKGNKMRRMQSDYALLDIGEHNRVEEQSGAYNESERETHNRSHVNAMQANHTSVECIHPVIDPGRSTDDIDLKNRHSDVDFIDWITETSQACSFEEEKEEINVRKRKNAHHESSTPMKMSKTPFDSPNVEKVFTDHDSFNNVTTMNSEVDVRRDQCSTETGIVHTIENQMSQEQMKSCQTVDHRTNMSKHDNNPTSHTEYEDSSHEFNKWIRLTSEVCIADDKKKKNYKKRRKKYSRINSDQIKRIRLQVDNLEEIGVPNGGEETFASYDTSNPSVGVIHESNSIAQPSIVGTGTKSLESESKDSRNRTQISCNQKMLGGVHSSQKVTDDSAREDFSSSFDQWKRKIDEIFSLGDGEEKGSRAKKRRRGHKKNCETLLVDAGPCVGFDKSLNSEYVYEVLETAEEINENWGQKCMVENEEGRRAENSEEDIYQEIDSMLNIDGVEAEEILPEISNGGRCNRSFFSETNDECIDAEEDESNSSNYDSSTSEDQRELRSWIVESRLPHNHSDKLLKILRKKRMPKLPSCTKTFLKKNLLFHPEKMEASDGSSGEFVYIGIRRKLRFMVDPKLHIMKILELVFNIDGFCPFKSSTCTVWPILCKIFNKGGPYKPFTVAVYAGKKKPKDVNEFLQKFVGELNLLLKNGIDINGEHFEVKIKFFVCDTPARAFLKLWVGHASFCACGRCQVKGRTVDNTVVFLDTDAEKRTDAAFRSFAQPDRHHGVSILMLLECLDFIYQFILDPMHQIYLSTTKRILDNLLGLPKKKKSRKAVKLSSCLKLELKRRTELIQSDIPDEFPRKMRPTDPYSQYKAVEYRFFLLYAAPFVLKKLLSRELYNNILILSMGCRLISSQDARLHVDKVRSWFLRFVNEAAGLYGQQFLSVVVHSLIHMCDDIEKTDCNMNELSAFEFESYLGEISRLLRSPKHIVIQYCNRMQETEQYLMKKEESQCNVSVLLETKNEIHKIKYQGMILGDCHPNNTVFIKNTTVAEIQSFKSQGKEVTSVVIKKFKKESFLDSEWDSENMALFKISHLSHEEFDVPLEFITQKFVKFRMNFSIQDEKSSFVIPLLP